jgi:predicted nucleic acid-binding protein
MNLFLFDASALIKRYYPEKGTALVKHLFAQAAPNRFVCLMLGAAEVAAALARKRNSGQLTPAVYAAAMTQLRVEVVDVASFLKLPADNALVKAAISLLDKHPINATDAVLLHTALDLATQFQTVGNGLVLVASDQRLLKAAQAEGLTTFDPETQSQAELDTLIASP